MLLLFASQKYQLRLIESNCGVSFDCWPANIVTRAYRAIRRSLWDLGRVPHIVPRAKVSVGLMIYLRLTITRGTHDAQRSTRYEAWDPLNLRGQTTGCDSISFIGFPSWGTIDAVNAAISWVLRVQSADRKIICVVTMKRRKANVMGELKRVDIKILLLKFFILLLNLYRFYHHVWIISRTLNVFTVAKSTQQ